MTRFASQTGFALIFAPTPLAFLVGFLLPEHEKQLMYLTLLAVIGTWLLLSFLTISFMDSPKVGFTPLLLILAPLFGLSGGVRLHELLFVGFTPFQLLQLAVAVILTFCTWHAALRLTRTPVADG